MAPSRAILGRVTAAAAAAAAVRTTAPRVPSLARHIHRRSFFPRPVVSRTVPAIFLPSPSRRCISSTSEAVEAPDYLNDAELHIFNTLKEKLQPTRLEVQDISGGCGSMYALDVVSAQFKGLSVIKQHRLVNSILGEEIKKWHGVQLKTKAP